MGLRTFLSRMGIVSSNNEVFINALSCKRQTAPAAMTVAATITAAQLLNGIITGTHAETGTQAYTLPTGADLDAALTVRMGIGASFDFSIINLSPADVDTITLTASVGITIVGQPIVHSNEWEVSYYRNTGMFRCRKTAADTFVVYRIGQI